MKQKILIPNNNKMEISIFHIGNDTTNIIGFFDDMGSPYILTENKGNYLFKFFGRAFILGYKYGGVYQSAKKIISIELAIKDEREVFLFDHFESFIKEVHNMMEWSNE